DLDLHDRLEQLEARLTRAFLEGERSGDLESGRAGVDVVVRAVDELHVHVDDGVAGEHAAGHGVRDALFDRSDELLGDHAADDRVLEDEARAVLRGADLDPAVTEHAAAARLLDVLALGANRLGDRLALGDLRVPHVALDLELALEAVDDDLEVQLAHAGDDGLPGLRVREGAEARVLGGELAEGVTELRL